MSTKQSHSVELPDKLRQRLELARREVAHHERMGNHDTYWHTELQRLERAAAQYARQEPQETDEAGEPGTDAPPENDSPNGEELNDD